MTKGIDELAEALEKPRAIRLLADWIAIDKGKTRLQGAEYLEQAEELYDYLSTIGFHLIPEDKMWEARILHLLNNFEATFRAELLLTEPSGEPVKTTNILAAKAKKWQNFKQAVLKEVGLLPSETVK